MIERVARTAGLAVGLGTNATEGPTPTVEIKVTYEMKPYGEIGETACRPSTPARSVSARTRKYPDGRIVSMHLWRGGCWTARTAPAETIRRCRNRGRPPLVTLSPSPFTLRVADDAIADLRERLARTRFPDEAPGEPWAYGTDVSYMRQLSRLARPASTGAPRKRGSTPSRSTRSRCTASTSISSMSREGPCAASAASARTDGPARSSSSWTSSRA